MRRKATRITANSVHETMASVMENGKTDHKFNRTCVYTKFAQITQKPLIQSNVPLFAQLVGWWGCSANIEMREYRLLSRDDDSP